MNFSYEGFQNTEVNYSHRYECYLTLDKKQYDEQSDESLKQDRRVNTTLDELKKRTTGEYFTKVEKVQVLAQDYARKVFPTYKFIQRDAIIDDWLSTVDFHKDHKTRDHSLHQTLTAYIVSEVLGQGDPTKGLLLPTGKTLLAQCAEQLLTEPAMKYLWEYIRKTDPEFAPYRGNYDDAWAAEVFYEAAFISALYHDMGYPWQYVTSLSKSIERANYKDVNGVIINPENAANKMYESLLIYPLLDYPESLETKPSKEKQDYALTLIKEGLMNSHGMPGAIGFMRLNGDIRYKANKNLYKEASFRLITDWAAVGIMMHDMPKLYWDQEHKGSVKHGILRLRSRRDPLSCLISLADILEEFERPKADFYRVEDKDKKKHVAVKYDFLCNETQLEIVDDRMIVTYLYATREEADEKLSERQKEVKEYLGAENGYLDLTSWGIVDGEGQTKMK